MTRSPEINYRYFRHYVASLPGAKGLRILDYGCGAGEIVGLLRESGFACEGCDVYYPGGTSLESPGLQGLMREGHVRAVEEDGELPYPAGQFDVVLSNQVFEHVRDLGEVLRRLLPVLKPDGHILAHFPSKEVMREGHIGIPFAHWFRRGSRVRRAYTLLLRRMGLGYFKREEESPVEWTERCLSWVDNYCSYVPISKLRRIMQARYTVSHNEMQYMLFRAGSRWWLRRLLTLPGTAPLWCGLFRRLAFMSVVLRPRRSPDALS